MPVSRRNYLEFDMAHRNGRLPVTLEGVTQLVGPRQDGRRYPSIPVVGAQWSAIVRSTKSSTMVQKSGRSTAPWNDPGTMPSSAPGMVR